jgi:hypothetical protein
VYGIFEFPKNQPLSPNLNFFSGKEKNNPKVFDFLPLPPPPPPNPVKNEIFVGQFFALHYYIGAKIWLCHDGTGPY